MKHKVFTAFVFLFVSSFGCAPGFSERAMDLEEFAGVASEEELNSMEEFRENHYYYYLEARLRRNSLSSLAFLEKALERDPDSAFLMKEMVGIHLLHNDNEKALAIMGRLVEKYPEDAESLGMYGSLKERLKDTEGAKQAYEQAVAAESDDYNLYLTLGEIYMEENNLPDAMRVYTKMAENLPEHFAGHFYMGKIFLMQNNADEAEKKFHETLTLKPELIEPRSQLLNIYKDRGDSEKIIKTYKDGLQAKPDDATFAMGLGCYYHKLGMAGEALEIFRKLGERSLSEPEILRVVFRKYISEKNYEEAVVVLDGMLKGAPENSDIHYVTGASLHGMGKADTASEHFQLVKDDSEFYENAIVQLAFIYKERKEDRKAIELLESVVKKLPDNDEFILYLGSFYEEIKEFDKAVALLKKGTEIAPENSGMHFRLGIVYDKMGNKEGSIASMKKVVEIDPQNANALNYLGYTYADLGRNLKEAEKLIKKALEYKPEDGYITDSLGWVYYKKGEFEMAVETLEKAVSLVPEDPIILEHLGDAYIKTKNFEKALEFYRKSLAIKEKDRDNLEKKIKELTQKDDEQ